MGVGLVGRTLGSLGIGNIGAEVFRMAKPFDMKFIAHDPFADKAVAAELGIELVGIEDLFRRADVLSVSCPLTPETRHIVNAERLALMKPTAYLINTARGPIVDQKALTKVLAGAPHRRRGARRAGAGAARRRRPDPQARQCHPRAARAVLDRSMLCRQRRRRCAGGDRSPARPRAARRRQSRSACHRIAGRSGWPISAAGSVRRQPSCQTGAQAAATFVTAAPDRIARPQRRMPSGKATVADRRDARRSTHWEE